MVLESADLIQFEERPAPLSGKSLPMVCYRGMLNDMVPCPGCWVACIIWQPKHPPSGEFPGIPFEGIGTHACIACWLAVEVQVTSLLSLWSELCMDLTQH